MKVLCNVLWGHVFIVSLCLQNLMKSRYYCFSVLRGNNIMNEMTQNVIF